MYIHLALIKQGGNTDTRMCTYIMSLAEDIEVAVSVHRGGPPLELLRCPIDRGEGAGLGLLEHLSTG